MSMFIRMPNALRDQQARDPIRDRRLHRLRARQFPVRLARVFLGHARHADEAQALLALRPVHQQRQQPLRIHAVRLHVLGAPVPSMLRPAYRRSPTFRCRCSLGAAIALAPRRLVANWRVGVIRVRARKPGTHRNRPPRRDVRRRRPAGRSRGDRMRCRASSMSSPWHSFGESRNVRLTGSGRNARAGGGHARAEPRPHPERKRYALSHPLKGRGHCSACYRGSMAVSRRLPLVAARHHLPGLPALLPGQQRRRRRRSAAASSTGSTTWHGSASTRSGSRRSSRRPWPTSATTSPTTPASTRCSARSTTSTGSSPRPTRAA